jgi:hypothetical protein
LERAKQWAKAGLLEQVAKQRIELAAMPLRAGGSDNYFSHLPSPKRAMTRKDDGRGTYRIKK